MTQLASAIYPKFRENIWRFSEDGEKSYLITSDEAFEVDVDDVKTFLKIRSHCTGHNSIEDIARKSGVAADKVSSIIDSLREIGVTYPEVANEDSVDVTHKKWIAICDIWSEELKMNFIGNQLMEGKLPKEALIGWLIEMYHYISDFPDAIDVATQHAEGELKTLLIKYANEERHHNVFVLRTLENLGISQREVQSSTPMLSTRLVGFIMRDLFQTCPSSVLLMAALVEANEIEEDKVGLFNERMQQHYHTPDQAFKPYFDHQDIDAKLGHVRLLKDNLHLLHFKDKHTRDQVVNKLHDLKHAFDLMGLEITHYYQDLGGKYFPRQPIDFGAI